MQLAPVIHEAWHCCFSIFKVETVNQMRTIFNTLLLSLLCLTLCAQNVNVPDPVFLHDMIGRGYDTNGDGAIQVSEAEAVDYFRFGDEMMTDLTGWEAFRNATHISIEVLDLIDSIDLSIHPQMEELSLINNTSLVNINLASNTILRQIYSSRTSLPFLDLSNNLLLDTLYFSNFPHDLDLSNQVNLSSLTIRDAEMTSLDLTQNTNLTFLRLEFSAISDLQLPLLPQLNSLWIQDIQVQTFDLSLMPNITGLIFQSQIMSDLDLSPVPNLESLSIWMPLLATLNLPPLPDLEFFDTSGPLDQILDLSPAPNIKFLEFFEINGITLDLTPLDSLEHIGFYDSRLPELDISSNSMLLFAYFFNTNVDSGELDFSQNSNLVDISIGPSDIEILNVKNGNPSSTIGLFELTQLKYICISADRVAELETYTTDLGIDCQVSSYCSFGPGGNTKTVLGRGYIGSPNCDEEFNAYIPILIDDGSNEELYLTNAFGEINLALDSGSYVLTPDFKNIGLFDVEPENVQIDVQTTGDTIRQDFCFKPKTETAEFSVHIFPIGAARPGFEADYRIKVKNNGSAVSDVQLQLFFEGDKCTLVNSAPAADLETTNRLFWTIEDFPILTEEVIDITMRLNSPMDTPALNDGDNLNFVVEILPDDYFPIDNRATLSQVLVNSYDPNDKTCLEGNTITPDDVGNYLHYMIRFENTGSAEAVNVVVTDTIDTERFDIRSFELLESSHEVKTRIADEQVIEYHFEDIYLPFDDENNDGFVVFRIRTLPSITLGESVENTAEIFFDFNFPIVTNTTSTIVELPSTSRDLNDEIKVEVYPNPVLDILRVQSSSLIKKLTLIPVTTNEVVLVSDLADQRETTIDVSDISPGVYLLKLETADGVALKKVIK